MITIIAAHARDAQNRAVIGMNGKMPWYLPNDLQLFRDHTMHKTLVMGRKTYESLPEFPLKNRRIAVLTKNTNYFIDAPQKDAYIAHNPFDLIEDFIFSDLVLVVCGGAKIYETFLPYASSVILTDINLEVDGDTYLPFTHTDLIRDHGFESVMIEKYTKEDLQFPRRVHNHEGQVPEEWTVRLMTRSIHNKWIDSLKGK